MSRKKEERIGDWIVKSPSSGGTLFIKPSRDLKVHEIPGEKVKQSWGQENMMNPQKESLVVVEDTRGNRIGSFIGERIDIRVGEDTITIPLIKKSTDFKW